MKIHDYGPWTVFQTAEPTTCIYFAGHMDKEEIKQYLKKTDYMYFTLIYHGKVWYRMRGRLGNG